MIPPFGTRLRNLVPKVNRWTKAVFFDMNNLFAITDSIVAELAKLVTADD